MPPLTDEQIRVKVAECCGYKWFWNPATKEKVIRSVAMLGMVVCDAPVADEAFWWGNTPDYPHDLNACAEMEKTLTEVERMNYRWKLQQGFLPHTQSAQELLCHAPARQRAITFLTVKGVLKEEKV